MFDAHLGCQSPLVQTLGGFQRPQRDLGGVPSLGFAPGAGAQQRLLFVGVWRLNP